MNGSGRRFRTLDDLLLSAMDVVFVGINPSLYSVERGHYFARPTNRFWNALSKSRLSEGARHKLGIDILRPEHDVELPRFGIGFTDVIKRPTVKASELGPAEFEDGVPRLLAKLRSYAPRVACFHGPTGYRPFVRIAFGGSVTCELGPQPQRVGTTRIFVVPNPSGANAHCTRAVQAAWYDRLAEFISKTGPG
jgi:TDG/mug DNA glycosylase family protein